MDIQIKENGDLVLKCTDEEREELYYCPHHDWKVIWDLFEPYSCNGSYTLFDASHGNPFVGLTGAPCIAESMSIDDDGKQSIEGRCWWFPDYQIKSFIAELILKGETTFAFSK